VSVASALAAFPAVAGAADCAALPAHTEVSVVDAANVLPPDSEASLAADLTAYHLAGHEAMVAATVSTLGGDDVASYARRLFDCWGVGDKGSDNGVLILVAMREHRTRVELGAGLTGRVTPEQLDLAVEAMTPPLRAGDVAGGLRAAAVALADDLGTPLPDSANDGTPGTDPTAGDGLAVAEPGLQPGPAGFDPYGTSESPGGNVGTLVLLVFLAMLGVAVLRFVLRGIGDEGNGWARGGFFGSGYGTRGYWGPPTVLHRGSWRDSGDSGWSGSMTGSSMAGGGMGGMPSGGSFGGGSSGGGGASGSW
jgi:uncharacterized protein